MGRANQLTVQKLTPNPVWVEKLSPKASLVLPSLFSIFLFHTILLCLGPCYQVMFVGTVSDLGFLIVFFFFFSCTNSTHPSGKGNNLFDLGQFGDLLLPSAGGYCPLQVVPWHLIQTGGTAILSDH